MTYRIEAIAMTLSQLQGHSYCKPFKCDFYARSAGAGAMLVPYLLSLPVRPSIRSSQVGVLLRPLNVIFHKNKAAR